MQTALFAALAVLDLAKAIGGNAPHDDFLSRACADWKLTQDDVQYFFAHATDASPEEIPLAYDALPCKYAGSLELDGHLYRFEINAGSFGVLIGTSAADTSYYGCKDRCARLFPFHVYGDE
jgi:hypothetical protein